jgi:hypothetical protein
MRIHLLATVLFLTSIEASAATAVIDFGPDARDPVFSSFVRDGFGATPEVTTLFETFSTGFPDTGSRILGLRYSDTGHGDLSGYARDDQSFLQVRLIRLDPTVSLRLDSFLLASNRPDFMFTTEVRVFSDTNSLLWSSGTIAPPATGNMVISPNVTYAGGLTINLYSATVFGIDQIRFTTIDTTTPAIPEPATWAMLICGFGLAGGALRQRRASSIA